jgi:hypothetical protein
LIMQKFYHETSEKAPAVCTHFARKHLCGLWLRRPNVGDGRG